jgi:DNA-directed RNA polymerase sigma subunit (sigma70/sigma32)
VNPRNGTITLVYGSEDIDKWRRGNCALDHAQRGGMTLDEVGEAMAVTRERARQIEERASSRLRLRREFREVAE